MISDIDKIALKRLNNQSKYDDDREPYCSICKDKRYVYVYKEHANGYGEIVARRCSCYDAQVNRDRIEASGLKAQIESCTFENFNTNTVWKKRVKTLALEYVENLDSDEWFVVSGAVGGGKTHICTAISKEVLLAGKSFLYFKYAEEMPLLNKQLLSFDADVLVEAKKTLDTLKEVEVLYIDDFLKIRNEEFIFAIIDYRYSNNLKTIISTELDYTSMAQIDEAIASRIKQKAGKYWTHLGNDTPKNQRL